VNIFHTLAEKAFEGRYVGYDLTVLVDLRETKEQRVIEFWAHPDFDYFAGKFYEASSEEQALSLLFIGEMYEDSKD
jgi:hypothetical protein